jgi:hypothetical protein
VRSITYNIQTSNKTAIHLRCSGTFFSRTRIRRTLCRMKREKENAAGCTSKRTDHHLQRHTRHHMYRSPPSRTYTILHVKITAPKDTICTETLKNIHAATCTDHRLQGHSRHHMYRSPPSRTYTPPHQQVSPYLQTLTFYYIMKQKNCTLTFKISLFLQLSLLNTLFYIIIRSVSKDKCYIAPACRSLIKETHITLHNKLNSIHNSPKLI